MAQVINGGDLMAFVDGKSIGFATSHTLTINLATAETTSKDSGGKWQSSEARLLSWTVDSENLMSNDAEGVTYDTLFNTMTARTSVTLKFAVKAETADTVPDGGWTPKTTYRTGSAYITALTLNAPNGDNATFTVSFTGSGPLTVVNG